MVGDDRLVRAVLNKTRNVFRFVNSQDIVTQTPPGVPLEHYHRHAGLEKYIDRNGVIRDHPSELDRGIGVAKGMVEHDGFAALSVIGHPAEVSFVGVSRTISRSAALHCWQSHASPICHSHSELLF